MKRNVIWMKKVAIFWSEKMSVINENLKQRGISGMTISTVSGCNNQREFHLQRIEQSVAYDLLPRVKLGIVVPDDESDRVTQVKIESSRTRMHGNGGVFVSAIERTFNIPTLDKDEKVIV